LGFGTLSFMKPLLVKEYLLNHTLSDLSRNHGVKARINGRKFSLNYDMIEAKDNDPLSSQCRGVVLYRNRDGAFDENTIVGSTEILCRPMERFFNHGQGAASNVAFGSSRIFEKLDGTMCALHFDRFQEQWHVATRSVSEADLPIDGFGCHTFRSLFEKAVRDTSGLCFEEWLSKENLDKTKTYIFELCTPENQIVVKYNDYQIFLLSIRNNDSGLEEEIDQLTFIPSCPSYELSSFDDMMKFISNRNASEHEGVVLRDCNFNRIKIKNANYLALNKIRDNALKSPRSLLQLALAEKLDDAIPLLPPHAVEKAEEMKISLRRVIINLQNSYADIIIEVGYYEDPREYRKQIALCVKKYNANMEYVMMRFTGKIAGFHDFAEMHKEANGDYKTSFLDMLLNEIDKIK